MSEALLEDARVKMDRAVEHLEIDLQQIRTGRASGALVENVKIELFGQPMQLKQVASISVPDPRSLAIVPWDRSNLAPIEKALRENQTLGLNPVNDGAAIRLNIPPLTEERRREIVKQMKTQIEECHISLRNARREILDQARSQEKLKEITQDDVKHVEENLNKLIDQYRVKIEEIERHKEREIMEV